MKNKGKDLINPDFAFTYKNMKQNLFFCLILLPELHGQISKLQAPTNGGYKQ